MVEMQSFERSPSVETATALAVALHRKSGGVGVPSHYLPVGYRAENLSGWSSPEESGAVLWEVHAPTTGQNFYVVTRKA